MRVWVPCSIEAFLSFDQTGSLEVVTGYSVTAGFAQGQADQDDEVLEAQILEIAGSGKPIVLVVEAMATAQAGDGGEVTLTQVINQSLIRAIFASSPQEPDEMLWFGPTEWLEVKDFLGLEIGA
ncbi:MAG: hypothetical protein NWQ60_02075 [Candidatus Nanopelagicales bacterium]|jgi:hypothetical protein|nr:hypothetical protein [Candidatus Nanopelagicales bacterium]